MKKNFYVSIFLFALLGHARALDVPMKGWLADELLDSKTCYGTITSNGKLVAYELHDLLISIDGRLVALPAVQHISESEYDKLRVYVKEGVSVSIVQKSYKKKSIDVDVYQVRERSELFISENGRKKIMKVTITSDCSP